MSYAVSIIVPIYNVEKYIEKCTVSLFEQNFDNIEYIFVNDATPDKSVDVLKVIIERYPQRKEHVKIIEHRENQGSGAARKTGVENARGNYIIYIDADDWCELDMISGLYETAMKDNADMVMCDNFINYLDNESYHAINYIKGSEFVSILRGELSGACWNKLVRKSLYIDNSVLPSEHLSMAEDIHLMIRLAFFAKTFSYVNKAYVHYRKDNANALTLQITDERAEDIKFFLEDINQFLIEKKVFETYREHFYSLVLYHKYYLIFHGYGHEIWTSHYPEANKISCLWQMQGLGVLNKSIRSLAFLNVSPVFDFLKYIFHLNTKRKKQK